MSTSFWQKHRRYIAGLAAGAVAASLVGLANPAGAIISSSYPPNGDQDQLTRIFGLDRYETATSIAGYPGTFLCAGGGRAIVASGANFPDALAASALSGALSAPILLVPNDGTVPATVRAAIGTGCLVTIVGGTAAVPAAAATIINGLTGLTATRLAGATRYDTALAVAAQVVATPPGTGTAPDIGAILAGTTVTTNLRTVIVATGNDFADALAGGPLANAGVQVGLGGNDAPHPIVLTDTNSLPAASVAALITTQAQQAIVLGGTSAVGASVVTQLQNAGVTKVVRVAGTDRFDTAARLNALLLQLGVLNRANVGIANFTSFADALAAGPFLGNVRAPLYGVTATSVPAATTTALNLIAAPGLPGNQQGLWAFGGTAAVTDPAALTALAALDSTSVTLPKPTLLSASGTLAASSQATATVGGLTVTAKAGGAGDGVAGNDWSVNLTDTNPTTVTVTVDTTNKLLNINGDLDNSNGNGAPTAADVVTKATASSAVTALFTVSGTAALPPVTSTTPLVGGSSTLTVLATFSQTLTAIDSTLFRYFGTSSATPAVGLAGGTFSGTVATVRFTLNATNQVPRAGVSQVWALPGAATSGTGANTAVSAVFLA